MPPKTTVIHLNRVTPPSLGADALTVDGWQTFKRKNEVYRLSLHNGEEPIAFVQRLDFVMRSFLESKNSDFTDENIITILNNTFAYAHGSDLLASLSGIKCKEGSVQAMASYIAEFKRTLDDDTKYPITALRKSFIKGIQVYNLKTHLESLAHTVETLKDLYTLAQNETIEWEKLSKKRKLADEGKKLKTCTSCGRNNHLSYECRAYCTVCQKKGHSAKFCKSVSSPPNRVPTNTSNTPSTINRTSNTNAQIPQQVTGQKEKKPIICHHCKKQGHIRPNCPERRK